MYTARDLIEYENTRIRITSTAGTVFEGEALLVTWACDEPDERDSIDIECDKGEIYCIFADEIASVERI